MASEAGCEGEPAVDGCELFAGSSGSGFYVGCTNYLGGTGASSTAAGGGLPGSLGTGLGRRDKSTCLCPDFNSCSGSCNGCQRHARYGAIMPQLGLTQMASAAGSGDCDWQFLWPRLTGILVRWTLDFGVDSQQVFGGFGSKDSRLRYFVLKLI